MPYREFKAIFRDLFNGSVSEAETITENYSDECNTDILTEEWERSQQQRTAYIINVVPKIVHVSH